MNMLKRISVVFLFVLALGACSTEEMNAQTPPQGTEYVASSQGRVYYWVGCSAWTKLKKENLRFFSSASQAQAAGYKVSGTSGCQGPGSTGEASRRSGSGSSQASGRQAPSARPTCTVSKVVDGDTVHCRDGRKLRLLLIDAPESAQGDYGLRAKLALEEMSPVGSRIRVELDVQERDRYNRTLAYIYTQNGTFINREMAKRGYALVSTYPPNLKYVDTIRAAMQDARANNRGLWRVGGFDCSPADYRSKKCGR